MHKETAEEQYVKMTETKVTSLVLRLGLPTTISMLVTNIYSMADTYFVSEINNSASGAVGVVFALMAIIQAFGFMYGHGAGSNIGRLLGAKDIKKAGTMASTSLFYGFISGLLIAIFGLFFQTPLMRLLGSTDTILPYASDYSKYILIAAPMMVSACVLNNILRYEGKAAYAMIGLVSGGVLNIIGDYYLIKVLGMGVTGAGISTAVSQCISTLILIIPFITGRTQSKLRITGISADGMVILNIVAIGLPSLMRQGLNSVSTMVLNKCCAVFVPAENVDATIAAMSIVTRVIGLLFCVGLGIGQGFQPVAGFNYGAKKYVRLKKAYWFTYVFGTFLLGGMAIFGFIFAPQIIQFFRDDINVVDVGAVALRYQAVSLLFIPMTVTGNMLFQSCGKSKRAIFLAATRSGLYFIPIIILLSNLMGLKGIEISQAIADVLAAVTTLPIVLSFMKSLPEDGKDHD